jgi:hypothetical protein
MHRVPTRVDCWRCRKGLSSGQGFFWDASKRRGMRWKRPSVVAADAIHAPPKLALVLDLLFMRWVRRLILRLQIERGITGRLSKRTWAAWMATMLALVGLMVGAIWILLNPSSKT